MYKHTIEVILTLWLTGYLNCVQKVKVVNLNKPLNSSTTQPTRSINCLVFGVNITISD